MFEGLIKPFLRLHVAVFRWTNGRVMSAMRGMPILLLTTTGRKTGKRRTTPLMYVRDGEKYVITASNSGRPSHPAWFQNLLASPEAQIELPGRRLDVIAAVATRAERDRLWPQLVARAPFFGVYQTLTSRPIPMVCLKPK